MVAAAMFAGEWGDALEWAESIPQFHAFAQGDTPRRSLEHFQLVLFRGACRLMKGDPRGSLEDLRLARALEPASYLPHYLEGRALVMEGEWVAARRRFVAACERLNPALATHQWKAWLSR